MQTEFIQARSLTKAYQTDAAKEVRALDTVDVDIEAGEFTILMGSSGSGKSTLLYLLSGLERPTAGQIHFEGQRVDELDETQLSLLRRKGFGFVFQAINLIPHLTLLENVTVPGYLVQKDRAAVERRAQSLLDDFGVGQLAGRLPAQCSGGEQQRAAIARALVNSPRAVLADEPTGALNSSAGRAVLEALQRINAEGQCVIMATHEVRAACYGTRVLFLRDGQVHSEYRHEPGSEIEGREEPLLAWLTSQDW